MYDGNLHITPEPDKGYPQPEVPADEAWNNMAELLNAEMPVSPPDPASSPKKPFSGRGGISGSIGQMLGSALLILGVAGLIIWGVLSSTHRPETSVTINDSNNSNKQESFAKINDSIIPVRDTKTHDSVNSIHQERTSPAVKIKTAEATDSHKIKTNLRLNKSANDKIGRAHV